MKYRISDEFGHPIAEMFIPWDDLWHLKRTLLVSVGFGEITWW